MSNVESPYPMLEVQDALAIVLQQASRLPAQAVDLSAAQGMILAEDVLAPEPLPPFPASVKDGYAVVAADGPGDYPIVGDVTAGNMADFEVKPGSVAYITTGAPMPAGADAVIMVEASEPLPAHGIQKRVRIKSRVGRGDDVREIGVDVAEGQTVLQAGDRLGPAEIGLLATVGASRLQVFRRPKVAVLSTGDELVEPGEQLGPGKIRDSNRATLRAVTDEVGGIAVDLGIGRDSQSQLEERINHGLSQADVLVTSGGVSMGDLDLLKPILENRGEVHFGRIRMKPGKPLTFATAKVDGQTRLIFALPGNPVSSLVTFYLFAAPAMRKMMGLAEPCLRRVQAILAQPLNLDASRPEYHRASLQWNPSLNDGIGGYIASSTGSQASSRLLSMRSANALLELPKRAGELAAGSAVTALMIGENL